MSDACAPGISIRAHLRALRFVVDGGQTLMPESSIEPVDSLPSSFGLQGFEAAGREALDRCCVIKLNGGLGTGMGLTGAKSLLAVRPGETFLDLIALQVLKRRRQTGAMIPLVFMNSERTRAESLAALAKYPDLMGDIPLDFLQHSVPRLDLRTGEPVDCPDARHLEWCPPGHGDLYVALHSSGMLDALRSAGIRYAFVSNADNLGGVLDLAILGWLASEQFPFVMEVARRTTSDKKGGHLALRGGKLVLRELAQCPHADLDSFQDTERHHFFNTNNLWLDLDALAAKLEQSPDGFPLPVIQNRKAIWPGSTAGPNCIQLETAMGSAIECFEGAQAIYVPRDRFCPVKTTNDLLAVWSDAYEKTADGRLAAVNPQAEREREIVLDPRFFCAMEDFESRFRSGAPSLRNCRGLTIHGDFRFGSGVSVEGVVRLENYSDEQVVIPDGTRLRGDD